MQKNQNITFKKGNVCGKLVYFKEYFNKYLIQINSNSINNSRAKNKFFALTYHNPKTLGNLVCVEGIFVRIDKENSLYSLSRSKNVFFEIKENQIKNVSSLKFKEGLWNIFVDKLVGMGDFMHLKIISTMPQPEASFVSGLILGQKTEMPKNLKNDLSKTGTTHLIALSGFNITIIINALLLFLKPFPKKYIYPFAIGVVFCFVILTGFSPSIIRAALMASILVIAKCFGRISTQSIVICISAFLITVFQPLSLKFDIGFQLSFLATIGLIYLAPVIEDFLKKYLSKIPKNLFEIIVATFSAQIMVLPILIIYFGQVSIISPLANLIIVPFIPVVMLIGFVQVLLSLLWIKFGVLAGYFSWLISKVLLSIIKFFAGFDFSQVQLKTSSWWFLVPYYFVIAFNIYYFILRKKYEKQVLK